MLENKVEFKSRIKMTDKEIYKRINEPPEYRSRYHKLHPHLKEMVLGFVNRTVELGLPKNISDPLLILAIALKSDPGWDGGVAERVFEIVQDHQQHNLIDHELNNSIAREILEFEEVEAFKEKNAQYVNYDPDYYDED